jgi:hypothetical protein
VVRLVGPGATVGELAALVPQAEHYTVAVLEQLSALTR